jgi:hypothetical protein
MGGDDPAVQLVAELFGAKLLESQWRNRPTQADFFITCRRDIARQEKGRVPQDRYQHHSQGLEINDVRRQLLEKFRQHYCTTYRVKTIKH